jgi:putative spermidine/putrescine transport system substrate-binding protein
MTVLRFLTAAGLALLTCVSARPAQAEELVVATFGGSFLDNTKLCHAAAFEKATGATVAFKLGSSSQHAASIRATGGSSDIDVAYLDDSLATQMRNEKLLTPIERARLSNAKDIASVAWGADDTYVVMLLGATAIVYNPKLVPAPPTSWLDLFDPKYAGKVAIGDISGTAGSQFLLMLNKLKGGTLDNLDPGLEAIKPLAKNSVLLYTQADQVVSLFERGEIAIAAWYPDRAGVAAAKGLPVAAAFPKEGAVGIRVGLVMPKGGKHADLALKYIDTVLSAEGQKCFSEKAFLGPTNTTVTLPESVAAFVPYGETREKLNFFDPEAIAKGLPVWTRRWQREVAR